MDAINEQSQFCRHDSPRSIINRHWGRPHCELVWSIVSPMIHTFCYATMTHNQLIALSLRGCVYVLNGPSFPLRVLNRNQRAVRPIFHISNLSSYCLAGPRRNYLISIVLTEPFMRWVKLFQMCVVPVCRKCSIQKESGPTLLFPIFGAGCRKPATW